MLYTHTVCSAHKVCRFTCFVCTNERICCVRGTAIFTPTQRKFRTELSGDCLRSRVCLCAFKTIKPMHSIIIADARIDFESACVRSTMGARLGASNEPWWRQCKLVAVPHQPLGAPSADAIRARARTRSIIGGAVAVCVVGAGPAVGLVRCWSCMSCAHSTHKLCSLTSAWTRVCVCLSVGARSISVVIPVKVNRKSPHEPQVKKPHSNALSDRLA